MKVTFNTKDSLFGYLNVTATHSLKNDDIIQVRIKGYLIDVRQYNYRQLAWLKAFDGEYTCNFDIPTKVAKSLLEGIKEAKIGKRDLKAALANNGSEATKCIIPNRDTLADCIAALTQVLPEVALIWVLNHYGVKDIETYGSHPKCSF